MLKKTAAIILAFIIAALCLPAGADGAWDDFDPIGQTFTGVRAPYMIEDGLPSQTDFFTDADFADNRITILNLWDSACLFCRLELPEMQQFSEAYSDSGVRVVGVSSIRMGGSYPAAYQYLLEFGITYSNVIPDEALQAIMFQTASAPHTFFVDSEGTVVWYIRGATTYQELESVLFGLIGMQGDANLDGEVSFADITLMYLGLTGEGELKGLGLLNADVDGDGQFTFTDVTVLYLQLLG